MASTNVSPDGGKTTQGFWKEEGMQAELLEQLQRELATLKEALEKTRTERDEQRIRADELETERQRACDELDVAQQTAKRLEGELETLAKVQEEIVLSVAQSKTEAEEARKAKRVAEVEKERLEEQLAKEREQVMVFECDMEEMRSKFMEMSKDQQKQRKAEKNSELEMLQQTIDMQTEEIERLQKLRAEEKVQSEDLLEQLAKLRLGTPRIEKNFSGLPEPLANGRKHSNISHDPERDESTSELDDVSSVGSSLPFTPRMSSSMSFEPSSKPATSGFRTKLNLSALLPADGSSMPEATPRTSQAAELALVALDDMEQELRAAGRLAEERGEEVQQLTARLLQEQRRSMSLQKQLAKAAMGLGEEEREEGGEYVGELERELAEARARVVELEKEGEEITEEVERALELMEKEVAEAKAGRERAERAGRELEEELSRTKEERAGSGAGGGAEGGGGGGGGGEEGAHVPAGRGEKQQKGRGGGVGLEVELEELEWLMADVERVITQLSAKKTRLRATMPSLWEHPEAARVLEENAELANRCLHLISQSSGSAARVKELEKKGQAWSREVEALEQEVAALSGQLASLETTLNARDQQVEDLESQLDKANGTVDMLAAQMAAMHEYLYERKNGNETAAASEAYQRALSQISPSKAARRAREEELQAQLHTAQRTIAVLQEQASKDREQSRSALVDFMRDFGSGGADGTVESQALQQEVHGLRALLHEKEAVMEKLAARAKGKKHKDWWRRIF